MRPQLWENVKFCLIKVLEMKITCNSDFGLSVAAEHNTSLFLGIRPRPPLASAKITSGCGRDFDALF